LKKRPGFLRYFQFHLRDMLITICILFCASGICVLLRSADASDTPSTLVFVLAVLLISRLTTGYLFGLISSFIGVVAVNYIFTYPYLALNFTLSGYPLTFLTMLIASIITCTLTSQAKQQERLRRETEKEKLRANLLRSVSHDIRTPLTSIVGATSAILDSPESISPEQERRLLEDMREDAQWLIRVVENLLSVTRIGSDPSEIVKSLEAAEEVLGEAVRKFRKRYPAIEIQVSAPEELLLVPMDAILIEQVLSNLLENAVNHGKATSIEISVCREDKMARFTVKDNGTGIPENELPTLFDGFLKHSGTRNADGTKNMGLGLMVCMSIVKAHSGTMSASNQTQGGAEIDFWLPLEKEERTYENS